MYCAVTNGGSSLADCVQSPRQPISFGPRNTIAMQNKTAAAVSFSFSLTGVQGSLCLQEEHSSLRCMVVKETRRRSGPRRICGSKPNRQCED